MPLLARVYQPVKDSGAGRRLIQRFGQMELVAGGLLMAIGGFRLRLTGDFGFVLIGSTLVILGAIRLWSTLPDSSSSRLSDDRVLMRLRSELSFEFSIAVDYWLDEEPIDYLIVGPPGVYVIHRYEHRGFLDGGETEEPWHKYPYDYPDLKPEERPDPEPVPNLLLELRSRIRKVQQHIEELSQSPEPIPSVEGFLVVTFLRSRGPLFNIEQVVGMDELTERLRTEPKRLSEKGVQFLTQQMNLEQYSRPEPED